MQNQKPSDFEDAPELPELHPLPPIPLISTGTIILCLCLGALATWCFSQSNWIGGWIDVFLIVLNVAFAAIRYRSIKRLYRHHHKLLTIQKIFNTPVMAEEGNSMILTFLRPSDRLMDEMKKIAEEVAAKKSIKQ